jgi:hypothetical protein
MRRGWLIGLLTLGCAESVVVGDVELEPRCEQDGAVELLDLEDDEMVGTVQPFDGDGFHIRIAADVEDDDDDAPVAETPARSVIVSACGEQVTDVPRDLQWVFVWEEMLLGCDRMDRLVQLDHLDDPSPIVLAQRGCAYYETQWGLIAPDVATGEVIGRLVAIRSIGPGQLEVHTLVDQLLLPGSDGSYGFGVLDDEIMVPTADGAVSSYRLATGTSEVVLDGVLDYQRSRTHLLYRPEDDIADGLAAVILRDRQTGTEVVLDDAFPASVSNTLTSDAAVLGWIQLPEPKWFWARDARPIVPPTGTSILGMTEGAMLWLASQNDATNVVEFSRWWEGQSPEPVMSCRDCYGEVHGYAEGLTIHIGAYRSDQELWFASNDGGPAQRLAAGVNPQLAFLLKDRRVLALHDEHDGYGRLVLHDYRDGSAATIAPRVRDSSMFLTWVFSSEDDLDVLYEADIADGEHALYHARLAPAR